MSFTHKIKIALNQPYPGNDNIMDEVKGIFIAALIVSGVLFAFRPFGLGTLPGTSILYFSLMFGGVTLVVGILYAVFGYYVLGEKQDGDSFTLKRWIVHVIVLIVFIAIGNMLAMGLFFNQSITLETFFYSIVNTAVVGVIPVTFFGFQNQVKLAKRHNQNAIEILSAINDKNKANDSESHVIAVESMQNYVNIYSVKGDSTIKETIRQTLAITALQYPYLRKCHRSFLINTAYVKTAEGNAQGLKLTLHNDECPIIPVSRAYINVIRQNLN